MTPIGKKKLVNSLWSLVYLALVIAIVVSATSIFKNFYYESVYVSGESMNPTFCGVDIYEDGELVPSHDYGVIDKDYGARKNIKRYQVVTTYYPGDPVDRQYATYKIKRVIAKPGEKFKIENYHLYLFNEKEGSWGEALEMPFERNTKTNKHQNYPVTTLANDEYFLAGDNWDNSYDCFDIGPINFDLLVGVVVKMEGRCIVQNGKVLQKERYKDGNHFFMGVDY